MLQPGEGKKALAKQTASCERLDLKDKAGISILTLNLMPHLEELSGF